MRTLDSIAVSRRAPSAIRSLATRTLKGLWPAVVGLAIAAGPGCDKKSPATGGTAAPGAPAAGATAPAPAPAPAPAQPAVEPAPAPAPTPVPAPESDATAAPNGAALNAAQPAAGAADADAGTASPATAGPGVAAVVPDVAAPPPVVETAKTQLGTASAKDSVASASALRTYLDANATAADAPAAATLLLDVVLPRIVDANVAGDLETAEALAKAVAAEGGGLQAALTTAAGESAEKLGQLIAIARRAVTADDVEALMPIVASSATASAPAKRLIDAIIAPTVVAFEDADPAVRAEKAAQVLTGDTWKCAAAKAEGAAPAVCGPEYFGLADVAQFEAVPATALPILRVARIAHLSTDKKPAGTVELPAAAEQASAVAFASAERAVYMPIETLVVSADGARVTERAIYDLGEGKLTAGKAWAGQVDQDAASLVQAKDTAGVEKLTRAVTGGRVDKAREDVAVPAPASGKDFRNGGRERGSWALGVAVDPTTPAKVLFPALAAALEAGYADARFLRAAGTHAPLTVPLRPAFIPEARRGRVEEPVRVKITAEGFTVTPPKFKGPVAPVEGEPVPLPEAAKAVMKGKKLVKVDVASTDVTVLLQAVASVRHDTSAGTVVVVDADDDIPASQVLGVLAALATIPGEAQKAISEALPGVTCQDETPSVTDPACRTLFPVLDVALPEGKKIEKPVEKPAEAPKEELGFCDQSDIERVIKGRTGAIRFCYERQLQMNNELTGRVVVRLKIGVDGGVVGASSSGNMPDKSVHECVVKAMRSLKFNPPAGGGACVVNYPFIFKP